MRHSNLTAYKNYQLSLKESFCNGSVHPDIIARFIRSAEDDKIIIYPALLTWDMPVFNRPHQLLREFSKRGFLVFFLTPDPKSDRAEPIREINPNLYLISDINLLYSLRSKPVILWITWPPTIVFREFFPECRLVYDMLDELDVFGWYCEFMEADHLRLLYGADYVFASSDSLYEKAGAVRQDAVLAPNGVCLEDFNCSGSAVPEDMKSILAAGRPVIGFYGLLDDWRMDYDLVNHICLECKEIDFVFIGPSYDESIRRINNSKNFFYLGPKDYAVLRHYLRCFDAAIIPYKITRLTESVFPLKLCEYMAGGRPIVATDMKECRKFRSVFISKDRDDFIANLKKALAVKDDPQYLSLLAEEAHANTWKARVDVIINRMAGDSGSVDMPPERQAELLKEETAAYERLFAECLERFSYYEAEREKTACELTELRSHLNAVLSSKTWRLGQACGRLAGAESPIRKALKLLTSQRMSG